MQQKVRVKDATRQIKARSETPTIKKMRRNRAIFNRLVGRLVLHFKPIEGGRP